MTPVEHDLVVRGGTVVTAEGRFSADVGVRGEVVAQIGGAMRGRREVDARGQLVTPGGVDPHVHLTCSDATPTDPGWVDDFESGTAAALAGGVTTVGNMSFVLPTETVRHRLATEEALARAQAIGDVFLHPVVISPTESGLTRLDDVRDLVDAGVTSLKFFMTFPTFDRHAAAFARAMRAAGETGAMTLIHCEDLATIECCTAMLAGTARLAVRHLPESRPPLAELIATQRAIAMCEATGAPTYIVHLSSARALAACAEARARGLPVYVETRPLYLHLTRERYEEHDGAICVAQPPLRDAADRQALWAGLADGSIDTVASDHAPWTRAMKLDPAHDLANPRPGVAEVETMLPLLFTEGVLGGRLTAERFVAVTSRNAARLFGLYPRKGTVAVGSDADLVVWQTGTPRTIEGSALISRAGHSPYEGRRVDAWPRVTLRRGEIVFEDGRVVGRPGSGRVLARGRVHQTGGRSLA